MATIGIDLGTTASAVAIMENDKPKIVEIDGCVTVPSIVNYSENIPTVGHAALLNEDIERTVIAIKRYMGTDLVFQGKSPAEISADILSFLKKSVERKLGIVVESAVVTVPAHFSELQRIATKQAASLAGIKVLRLINEPTAAALAFGINQNGVFAVYDLGGGTFDFSVLRVVDGIFQVLSTGGDNYLGGNDVDESILNENMDRYEVRELSAVEKNSGMLLAKYLKEHIKDKDEISVDFKFRGESYAFSLDQKSLRSITKSIFEKTNVIIEQVLEEAHVTKLNGLILVGGMTKLRLIKDLVIDRFKDVPVFDNVNPEEAVALGAVLDAYSLLNQNSGILLIDVVPLSLGIETLGGGVDKIIHRNTPIPISEKRQYTTYQDNQTGMKFRVVQGERPIASECRSLANFELKGIPPMPAGVANVIVTFSVDVNGLLQISAREESTGIEQKVIIEPSMGLTDDDMVKILENAFKNQEKDNDDAKNIKLIVDTNRLITFWRSIVSEIPNNEAQAVKRLLIRLETFLKDKKYTEITQTSNEIEQIIGQFIDGIINNHLCGRRVKG